MVPTNNIVRLGRQLRQFGDLPAAEQLLLLAAVVILPCTVIGLRVFGFQRWYSGLGWLAQGFWPRRTSANRVYRVHRTFLLLRLATRYTPNSGNCLSQSLTLWWLLRCQGIDSDLRIGVCEDEHELKAHAWIEYKGQPVNDTPNVYERFVAFDKVLVPKATKFL